MRSFREQVHPGSEPDASEWKVEPGKICRQARLDVEKGTKVDCGIAGGGAKDTPSETSIERDGARCVGAIIDEKGSTIYKWRARPRHTRPTPELNASIFVG